MSFPFTSMTGGVSLTTNYAGNASMEMCIRDSVRVMVKNGAKIQVRLVNKVIFNEIYDPLIKFENSSSTFFNNIVLWEVIFIRITTTSSF